MAVNRERRCYILSPGHSVRQIQGIHFGLSRPIPEREKQPHLWTVLNWTAEPAMSPSVGIGAEYPRDDPGILKTVIPLRRRMGRVGQFTGRGKPWDELFAGLCGCGESQPRHCSSIPARFTASSILLDRAALP